MPEQTEMYNVQPLRTREEIVEMVVSTWRNRKITEVYNVQVGRLHAAYLFVHS